MLEGSMSPEEMRPEEFEPLDSRMRKSGLVTAVGVINLVLGGLNIVCGLLLMVAGAFFGKLLGIAGDAAQPPAGLDPEAAAAFKQAAAGGGGIFAMAGAFLGVCVMVLAIPSILAGVGVLQRKQWGRILTLVLGALAGLGALIALPRLPGSTLNVLIGGGYCAFVYVVLLNKQYAAEFR
jgi:hypothetical protein